MNYKKKSLLLSIFFILTIQTFLLINNKQKTSFRYFIWNIQEVSIGRLIFASFFSGLLISSFLNKTLNTINLTTPIIEAEDRTVEDNDYLQNRNLNDEPNEITPERDLREPQPTISVNYRVIKNNVENGSEDRNQTFNNSRYDDDWSDKSPEW